MCGDLYPISECAANGEIVWAYDKELKAARDGVSICGDDWDGLSKAVSGVAKAKSVAESARNNHTTGVVLRWTAIPVMIGGIVLGLATLSERSNSMTTESSSSPSDYSGFWIMMGGVTIGTSMIIAGDYYVQQGTADAIDAVNIYNSTIENSSESKK